MPRKKRVPAQGSRKRARTRAKKPVAIKRKKPPARAAKKSRPKTQAREPAKKRAKKPAKVPAKKRVKKPAKIAVSKAPPVAAFYREPVAERKLIGLPPKEARHVVAQERAYKVAKLKEDIETLRRIFGGFEARDGYPLTTEKLIRLPAAKLDRIRKYMEQYRRATSVPTVQFTPKTYAERRAAIQRAGLLGLKQKVFFIHHSDARIATARYVKDEKGGDRWGTIEIVTQAKGGVIRERIYYFPHRPRSWDDVVSYTEELLEAGMLSGFYKIFNSIYGPIGDLVEREKLIETLEGFYSTYNAWLAGTILGWVWLGTSYDDAADKQEKQRTTAQRFQEARAKVAKREAKAMRDALSSDVKSQVKRATRKKRPKRHR